MKNFINKIKDEYLEKLSFILILLWTTSPIIVYTLKRFLIKQANEYFVYILYITGIIGLLSYIIYFINLKEKNKKKFIPELLIIILLIISIISSILSKNPLLSIFGENYRKEGLIIYIMYIGILLTASTIKKKEYIAYIFKSIIISGLYISILPFTEKYFTYNHTLTNIFHQFNHYGYYLMINTMLSAFFILDNKKNKKIFYSLTFIFFTYLLVRNNTFGCYLSILISLTFLFIYSIVKKYKRFNIIIIILLFIITSFATSHYDIKIFEKVKHKNTKGTVSSNLQTFSKDINNILKNDKKEINKVGTGRGQLWKEAINYTLKHPIFGGGMECLKEYYKKKGVTYNDRPHNSILQVSSFIGIPGAIIYITLILYIAISNIKLLNQDILHITTYFTAMSYFISSLFGNSMYYTSPYFMILLGLLISFNHSKNTANNKK